jgi:hypothetical protein
MIEINPGDKILVEILTNPPKTYLVGTVDVVSDNSIIWRVHFRNMEAMPSRRSRLGVIKVLHPETDLGEAYEELIRIQNARDHVVAAADQTAMAMSESVDVELMKRRHG